MAKTIIRQSNYLRAASSRALIAVVILAVFAAGCHSSDNDPPSITASVSPKANPAGWHNVDATVTFECSDSGSGILTCPGPVVVNKEGENQVVTGTAVDWAGNTASVSVTVNLDKTPPVLSGYQPSDGERLPDPEVNLVGKVGDTLSGIMSVTCDANGASQEASIVTDIVLDERVFSCSLPLNQGPNVVTVRGTDVGGNATWAVLTIHHALPPKVAIDSPPLDPHLSIGPSSILVAGTIDDASATVTVNDVPASVAGGRFSALVPLKTGVNTITAVAQNVAGSGSASVNVLAVVVGDLNPTVLIVSPGTGFVLGGEVSKGPVPVTVEGWVRDNRFLPASVRGTPDVTVLINNEPIVATVTQGPSGLCLSRTRCWRYSATKEFAPPAGVNVSIAVSAQTGDLTTTGTRSGIVDFCYENNGGNITDETKAASRFQDEGTLLRGEPRQSRRCIQNADGCSAPLGAIKEDPTQGKVGRAPTAFGVAEDANTPEGAFTVYGQRRPIQLPCNRHDECYHQWCPREATPVGVVGEKYRCDFRFYDDMKEVCRRAYPEPDCPQDRIGVSKCVQWWIEKKVCNAWALIYYDAVFYDTPRYLLKGPYANWPYGGYLTPCENCPPVQ